METRASKLEKTSMKNTISQEKTAVEVEDLKQQWLRDPFCWDIETTEGFEAHKQELLAFRQRFEADLEERHRLIALRNIRREYLATFATAALTGLLAGGSHISDDTVTTAFGYAEEMIQEYAKRKEVV